MPARRSSGSLLWMRLRAGILEPNRPTLFAWVTLVVIGGVLGLGLSWSLFWERITGQVETD